MNPDQIADELGAAIAARDTGRIGALYADDVVIWHASWATSQTKAENLGLLGKLFAITSALEYREIRRHAITGGVVQQHQLTGKFADGSPMPALEACMVIKIVDGKIVRLDEYFDSQTFADVWARL